MLAVSTAEGHCAQRRQDGRSTVMHTHFSVLSGVSAFLSVAIIGGVWRLGAGHLVRSSRPTAQLVGKTMLFQY